MGNLFCPTPHLPLHPFLTQLPRITFIQRTASDAATLLAWLNSAPSHICFA